MQLISKVKKILYDKEKRLIYTNISLNILFKVISLGLSIINTKLYIEYFDNNVLLGGWYALVTILNWIINFDLGIGNGLRNGIVIPYERNDYCLVKKYISSGYIIVGTISTLIFLVSTVFVKTVNWNKILNISTYDMKATELKYVVLFSLVGVCLHFGLKTITSIMNALRKTFVSGITALTHNVLIFSYLYWANTSHIEGTMLQFSIVYSLASTVPLMIVTLISFRTVLKNMEPRLSCFDSKIAKKIASLGLEFFAIQIALMLISSTDSWLISYYHSPVYAVDYQLYYRFFSIALTVFTMFSQTVWSSVTKYKGEGRLGEVSKLYKMLNSVALLGGVISLGVAVFFKPITNLLMQDTYHQVEFHISLLFVVWFLVQMLVNASTAVANGLEQLSCQMIFVPVAGVLKIILVILSAKLKLAWYSIIVSNMLSMLPLLIAQYAAIQKEMRKHACRI